MAPNTRSTTRTTTRTTTHTTTTRTSAKRPASTRPVSKRPAKRVTKRARGASADDDSESEAEFSDSGASDDDDDDNADDDDNGSSESEAEFSDDDGGDGAAERDAGTNTESDDDDDGGDAAWLRPDGRHWREVAERRAAGLDDDETKNTYAYFASCWRRARAADRAGNAARSRRLVAEAWRTYVGRPLARRVEHVLASFGTQYATQAVRTGRIREALERGTLAFKRKPAAEHHKDRCGACGLIDKFCSHSMRLVLGPGAATDSASDDDGDGGAAASSRVPVGSDCVHKVRALVALFAHLRSSRRVNELETARLTAALDAAMAAFAGSLEDKAYARGWAKAPKEGIDELYRRRRAW